MPGKMKRVYHPTVNAWQDVPPDAVKDWTDAGWKTSKPEHVHDEDYPPVGQGYVAATTAVYEDPGVTASRSWDEPSAPAPEPEPEPKGEGRKAK